MIVQAGRRSEIDDYRAAIFANQNIGRLQIAVDETRCVNGGNRIGESRKQIIELLSGHVPAGGAKPGLEIDAVDQLQNQEAAPCPDLRFLQADDAGMIQGLEDRRLALDHVGIDGPFQENPLTALLVGRHRSILRQPSAAIETDSVAFGEKAGRRRHHLPFLLGHPLLVLVHHHDRPTQ